MRRVWPISVFLFLVTLAVFSRVLVADFVQWDDDISVYQNPNIQGLDWGRVRWMFTDVSYAMRYKPLTWLSYALIYQSCGLKPAGYHFANLLLHCANAVLVFLVVRRLLALGSGPRAGGDSRRQATIPAAAGALLWALNPLRVEPVARVTDLTFCLQMFFLLISVWCYLTFSGGRGGGRTSYWCSVAAFALAMLAYPFAFAYAVVLVMLDWYPLRRFAGGSGSWRQPRMRGILLEKLPFLLFGGLMLTTVAGRLKPGGIWAGAEMDNTFNLFERAMQAFYVWAYYLWKPWWPAHLSPLYTTLVDFNPHSWPFWLSAALVIGLTTFVVWRRRRWPWALVLWASYLVLMVPVLGLTEHPHYTADRYDYAPGLIWAVAVAALLLHAGSRPGLRIAGLVLSVCLAGTWGLLSLRQVRVWRNSVALFEHMIRELGDDPSRGDIQWRLGGVFASEGKTREAIQQYEDSLRSHPSPEARFALADLLQKHGDRQGALTNCQAALTMNLTPLNRVQAGQVLAALGFYTEAIAEYRKAIASVPDLVPALNNLAWVLASAPDAANRNGAEAVQLAERACTLTGYHVPVAIGTLAAAYAEAGRFKEAVAAGEQARALALATGQRDVAERNGPLLELYRSGKPYHERAPRQSDALPP